jgi:hypothetical protein
MGLALLRLFHDHHRDGRVILPLLVTADKLISHGCLDCLIMDPLSTFSASLFDHVSLESSACTDVKRLMTMVPVLLGLMSSANLTLVSFPLGFFPIVK